MSGSGEGSVTRRRPRAGSPTSSSTWFSRAPSGGGVRPKIAQETDEIGGQTDDFTSHEYAGFHAKVLDEHVVRAVDLLSDIVSQPRFDAEDIDRERKAILDEMRSIEDTPDDMAHDLFTESF